MKMIDNVASIVEKHQQFMKKLGYPVATGANINNPEDESLSRVSKPSSDTTCTSVTNHNNNLDKNCVAKDISPALSSSKTVLTPKEYLDKKIKERINRESLSHEHQEAKHAVPSTSDKQSLVKINGGLASEHHYVGKAQMVYDASSISSYKNSNSNQNASKNYSELSHKFDNSEPVHKSHKIHSESRHKAHKVNSSANNKSSKVHSDTIYKSSKEHTDPVNIISTNAYKLARSHIDANARTSGLTESGHREFKTSDYKIPKSGSDPTPKISKSHSEPDDLAFKYNSLFSDPSNKSNKDQTNKGSPKKIHNVLPDSSTFKTNEERLHKVTSVHSNYDNKISRGTDSTNKTAAAINIDNKILRFPESAYKATNEQLEFNDLMSMQEVCNAPPEFVKINPKIKTSSIDNLNRGIKIQIVNAPSDQLTYKIPKIKGDSYKDYKNSSNSMITGRMNLESGYKYYDSINNASSRMNLETGHKNFDIIKATSDRMNMETGQKNSDSLNNTSSSMNLETSLKNLESGYKYSDSSSNTSSRMNMESSHRNSDNITATSVRMTLESGHKCSDSSNNTSNRMNMESSHRNSDNINATSGRMNLESGHKYSENVETTSKRINLESNHKNSADLINTSSIRMKLESGYKSSSDSINTTSGRTNLESGNRKFKSSSEYDSKMARAHSSSNIIPKTNYEPVHKVHSETSKEIDISKMDPVNDSINSSFKKHHELKSSTRTETELDANFGNNLNSVEKSKVFKLNNITIVPTHTITKSSSEPGVPVSTDSSYLKPPKIHSDHRLPKTDQNAALKGLVTRIHSESSHKIRKSHKSHKSYSEKDHKRDVSLDSSSHSISSKSHSRYGNHTVKLEASLVSNSSKPDDASIVYTSENNHPTAFQNESTGISSEYPAESKNTHKRYSHRTIVESNRVSGQLSNDLPFGKATATRMLTSQSETLKSKINLNENLFIMSDHNETENHSTSINTSLVPKMECEKAMNTMIKDNYTCTVDENIKVKNDILTLKEENKELVSFKGFNFNSNFLLHDVLKPSEKPPEDIFDTETDFKIAPCVSNVNTASSESANPVTEFLKPELPPRLIDSQPLKSACNISNRSTPIYSLLPAVQQSLHRNKNIGNDSSIVPKHSSAFAVSTDKDPPITTEQVHAFYKEIEARKLAESRLEGISDNRSLGQTSQAETSGTFKKYEHKSKKRKKDKDRHCDKEHKKDRRGDKEHKKDRHSDKEHKKNKKSKKDKKEKHRERDREKGEEPLPSIKISVFNNLYMSKPEYKPSQSENHPNNGNVSEEPSSIKLTIPFSRIHSNINTTSLEIQSHTPKIKLKIPKESKKKSSKRSRDNSPDNELLSSKRSRRSVSLTNLHNADYLKLANVKSSKHSHNTNSPQASSYGSAESHTAQDQNKIQIRHFSCIS